MWDMVSAGGLQEEVFTNSAWRHTYTAIRQFSSSSGNAAFGGADLTWKWTNLLTLNEATNVDACGRPLFWIIISSLDETHLLLTKIIGRIKDEAAVGCRQGRDNLGAQHPNNTIVNMKKKIEDEPL
jgi:hypothetical protein